MRVDGFYPSKKIKIHDNHYWIDVNLWPFVGVLLVLLIIMMVSSGPPFATHHRIPIDLPRGIHALRLPWAVREDAIHIYVLRDGRVFIGNSRSNVDGLHNQLQEDVKNGSERHIYIGVDRKAQYGTVKRVLDEVRDAKIENVSFIVNSDR
jgi:biopolymer transport protein TolR